MRTLVLILALAASALGQSVSVGGTVNAGGTYNIGTFTVTPPTAACAGYATDIPVKLQKASGSDQTNIPVRVYGRDYRLASSANGGNVQNSTTNSIGRTVPADLIFATTTSTATALKHETVLWDATTGDYEFWVQQPTLHTASNDTIHICVNNASVTTSQDDLSLWSDVNYIGVWHFPRGSVYTSPDLKNSVTGTAASAHNIVNQNFGSTGDGVWLAATGNVTPNWVQVADTSTFRPTTVTVEGTAMLFNTHINPLLSHPYSTSSTLQHAYALSVNVTGVGTDFPVVVYAAASVAGVETDIFGTTSVRMGNYFDVAMTYDSSTLKGFMEGALDVSQSLIGGLTYSAPADIGIGNHSPYGSFPSYDYLNGNLDEIWLATGAKSDNWIATDALNRKAYSTSSEFADTSFAKPKPIQRQGCHATTPASATCALPFDVTSGVMVALVVYHGSATPVCPASGVTDTLGLTYTNNESSYYIGSLEYYVTCLYTAPITSSGADTVTISSDSRDVAAEVYEVRNATVTGIVTTNASTHPQPFTMTATSPSSNAILFCAVNTAATGGATADSTNTPGSVSPSSYRLEISPTTVPSGSHFDFAQIGWGTVGSGSQSCSFNGGYVGRGGVLGILAYAP